MTAGSGDLQSVLHETIEGYCRCDACTSGLAAEAARAVEELIRGFVRVCVQERCRDTGGTNDVDDVAALRWTGLAMRVVDIALAGPPVTRRPSTAAQAISTLGPGRDDVRGEVDALGAATGVERAARKPGLDDAARKLEHVPASTGAIITGAQASALPPGARVVFPAETVDGIGFTAATKLTDDDPRAPGFMPDDFTSEVLTPAVDAQLVLLTIAPADPADPAAPGELGKVRR